MLKALLVLLCAFAARAEPSKPRVAVVIDDFGLTYPKNVPDEDWMRISWPITYAVMPESPRTGQAAKRTKETGHELIIHFPFDPFQSLKLPKDSVDPEDFAQVERLLDKAFKQIPGPVGLNNHRSYKSTMNRPMMAAFMKLLKPRGGYFLDSKVSPKTVAYDEAQKAGIPAAKNYIFMEEPGHYNDKAFAAAMLRQAAARARKNGSAIIIGHHYYRGTYDALVEEVPKLQKDGIEFVFASKLAR
jgi:uncharacterized protein